MSDRESELVRVAYAHGVLDQARRVNGEAVATDYEDVFRTVDVTHPREALPRAVADAVRNACFGTPDGYCSDETIARIVDRYLSRVRVAKAGR